MPKKRPLAVFISPSRTKKPSTLSTLNASVGGDVLLGVEALPDVGALLDDDALLSDDALPGDDALLVVDALPEASALRAPTSDAPTITVRHLVSMESGLPTDDAWADHGL